MRLLQREATDSSVGKPRNSVRKWGRSPCTQLLPHPLTATAAPPAAAAVQPEAAAVDAAAAAPGTAAAMAAAAAAAAAVATATAAAPATAAPVTAATARPAATPAACCPLGGSCPGSSVWPGARRQRRQAGARTGKPAPQLMAWLPSRQRAAWTAAKWVPAATSGSVRNFTFIREPRALADMLIVRYFLQSRSQKECTICHAMITCRPLQQECSMPG